MNPRVQQTTRTRRLPRGWWVSIAGVTLVIALGIWTWTRLNPPGRLEGVRSYAVYYGNNLEYAANLEGYDLGIVQPNTLSLKALRELRASGKKLVAYITIGESDGPSIGLPEAWVLGTNQNWGSKFVDANQTGWQDRILERATDIMSFGFDGFFLDTLDTVDLYPQTKPGMIRIVERLRERFPRAIIVQNRGFAVLNQTAPLVDAVMFEAYSTDFDFQTRQYKAADGDASMVLPYVGRHLKILALDYAETPALKTRATERARAAGFIPFVTTISLNTLEPNSELNPERSRP
jgi:uncharacterized protein (TIGR01370 family)